MVTEVERGHRVGPSSSGTGVPITRRRDTKDTCAQSIGHVRTKQEGRGLPAREGGSGEAHAADTLILNFWSPELGKINSVVSASLSVALCYGSWSSLTQLQQLQHGATEEEQGWKCTEPRANFCKFLPLHQRCKTTAGCSVTSVQVQTKELFCRETEKWNVYD